jgi:hypothetical protein
MKAAKTTIVCSFGFFYLRGENVILQGEFKD